MAQLVAPNAVPTCLPEAETAMNLGLSEVSASCVLGEQRWNGLSAMPRLASV